MMKRIFVFAVLLYGLRTFAGTCGDGYTFSRQVLLAKAVGSDQSNFVAGGRITDPLLATAANGGQVQNTANNAMSISGPADFIVCDAASAGNAIPFEIPYYDATTGQMEIWFLMSTLHTASNDSVYFFANNAAVVTSQQDSGLGTTTNLWATAGYTEVCHFPDGTTLNVNCSLPQGTSVNHSAAAVAGRIDGGAQVTAASTQYIDLGSSLNTTTPTLEIWGNFNSFTSCGRLASNLTASKGYELLTGKVSASGACTGNGLAMWQVLNAGTYIVGWPAAATVGYWHQYSVSQTGTTVVIYYDGTKVTAGSTSGSQTIGTSTNTLLLGKYPPGTNYWDGKIDEFRLSTSVRTDNWIASNYYYQSRANSTMKIVEPSYPTGVLIQFALCGVVAASGTATCTFPFPVTAGHTLVFQVGCRPSTCGSDLASIGSHFADSVSTTYTTLVNTTGTNVGAGSAFGVAGGSGANTLTYTYTAGLGYVDIWIGEFGGIATPSVDVTNSATNTTSSSINTGSATATTANSLLVCTVGDRLAAGAPAVSSFTPAGGTTYQGATESANVAAGFFLWQSVGAGSQSCSFTFPSNTDASAATLGVIKYTTPAGGIKHRVVRH